MTIQKEAVGKRPGQVAGAWAAVVVTLSAVAAVYLFPYVTRDLRLPLGWDAAAYVARANEVAADGLDRFGAIRAASPLLLTVLMRITGENGFTLVAVVPPLLAAVAALGAAAMVRSALGIGAAWIPIIGFLAWAAFGENGMMNVHLDNLTNAALLLPGLATVLASVAGGRGRVAATLLFMGAGLAHWPFYVFGMVVFGSALLAFAFPVAGEEGSKRLRAATRLAAPIGTSGLFVGLTFLWLPGSGWVGARLGALGDLLRERFLGRLPDPDRYYAVPLAAGGAAVSLRAAARSARWGAARLFACLMGAWVLATIVGGIAQFAGIPTAGARLLHFLFPIPILAGVFVWWLARRISRRRSALAAAGGLLVVAVAVGALGTLTVVRRSDDRAWIDLGGLRQVSATAPYVASLPPNQTVVFVLDLELRQRPSWAVIKATLPGSEIHRLARYYGSPADYLAGVPSGLRGDFLAGEGAPSTDPQDQVAIVLSRFNASGFEDEKLRHPDREIEPGVLVLRGPVPSEALPAGDVPLARTGSRNLVRLSVLILFVLYVSGGGWALGLLPPDPVIRAGLAPALGIATITLVALLWDRVGLSLVGSMSLGPVAVAGLAGWGVAGVTWVRGRRKPIG
jgi:hypothetical protein